jgi:hypothetical protein
VDNDPITAIETFANFLYLMKYNAQNPARVIELAELAGPTVVRLFALALGQDTYPDQCPLPRPSG